MMHPGPPTDLRSELFLRATFMYPAADQLSPEVAANLLTKASSLKSQLQFAWSYIDKHEVDGQIYLVYVTASDDQYPHDGLQYMSEERHSNVTLQDGRVLRVSTRMHGFRPQEQYTSMVRTRFRLLSPGEQQLEILYYKRMDQNARIPADSTVARPAPRRYPLPQISTQPSNPFLTGGALPSYHVVNAPISNATPHGQRPFQMPSQHGFIRPPAQMPVAHGFPQHSPPRASPKKQIQNPQQVARVPHAPTEEAEEPSGDELDHISFRELAMARYKRNHDYMSEIFTPYNASRLIPVSLNLTASKGEKAKELKAKIEEDVEAMKAGHAKRMEESKRSAEVLYKGLRELKDCKTMEELDALQKRIELQMGMRIERRGAVTMVELDLPESPEPQPKGLDLLESVVTDPSGDDHHANANMENEITMEEFESFTGDISQIGMNMPVEDESGFEFVTGDQP
ncbi:uncharacterized protein VTP21DRAFT_2819 [Calcarisporiella thermophila]|uniref:uncharacterized protein n=1 Tax=Calcarisporiella thermophila TaxID=911321 RepID=UPI003743A894